MSFRCLATVALGACVGLSWADDPVYSFVNGHYYQKVQVATGIDWATASAAAGSSVFHNVSGHLATLATQPESAAVVARLGDLAGYWIGGLQAPGSPEPGGGWEWITGEPWSFANWRPGEPNDNRSFYQGLNEDRLALWDSEGRWNDAAGSLSRPENIHGYVVEYDTEPVPLLNPANGHSYEVAYCPEGISWIDAHAQSTARSYGGVSGHLATITSAGEQAFLHNAFGPINRLWLGGCQPPGSSEPIGSWQWCTGEPWVYSNWISGEPNELRSWYNGLTEDRLVTWDVSGHWNDLAAPNARPADTQGYVVEYETGSAHYVSGSIEFQDWLGATPEWADFRFVDPGSGLMEMEVRAPLAPGGRYGVYGPGTPKHYLLVAKSGHWLGQARSVDLTSAGAEGVNFSLPNGDVDGDNAITVFDYNLLSDAFDASAGDSGWNPNADLDGDGSVTVYDYNILSSNFDRAGE